MPSQAYRPGIKRGSANVHLRKLSVDPLAHAQFFIDGDQLAADMEVFIRRFLVVGSKEVGIPVTLGGATIFRKRVREQQKAPRYALTRKGRVSKARHHKPSLGRGHMRPVPGTGRSWWSGTLRRAIHARVIAVGKYVTWSATAVDPRKGQPPRWAWWRPREGTSKRREMVNAYEYAKYNEFGTKGRKAVPIFTPAYKNHHKEVAWWMQLHAWLGMRRVASKVAGPPRKHARRTRSPRF